jgi:hypothetical protein
METIESDRPAVEIEVPAPRRRPSQRVRRRRLFVLVLASALFASAVGSVIADQVSEDEHFDRLHASLLISRHRAAEVAHDLAQLRHDVAVLMANVKSSTTTWNQNTAQLKAAQFALAVARSDVSQQGTRIAALNTCLGGVQQALNALAINNQATAISELNSVGPSCSTASGG